MLAVEPGNYLGALHTHRSLKFLRNLSLGVRKLVGVWLKSWIRPWMGPNQVPTNSDLTGVPIKHEIYLVAIRVTSIPHLCRNSHEGTNQ